MTSTRPTCDAGRGRHGTAGSPGAGGRPRRAFDALVRLYASANTFGTRPDQDPALVEVMEAWGFTWGGRWQIPDGMHSEWRRFP